ITFAATRKLHDGVKPPSLPVPDLAKLGSFPSTPASDPIEPQPLPMLPEPDLPEHRSPASSPGPELTDLRSLPSLPEPGLPEPHSQPALVKSARRASEAIQAPALSVSTSDLIDLRAPSPSPAIVQDDQPSSPGSPFEQRHAKPTKPSAPSSPKTNLIDLSAPVSTKSTEPAPKNEATPNALSPPSTEPPPFDPAVPSESSSPRHDLIDLSVPPPTAESADDPALRVPPPLPELAPDAVGLGPSLLPPNLDDMPTSRSDAMLDDLDAPTAPPEPELADLHTPPPFPVPERLELRPPSEPGLIDLRAELHDDDIATPQMQHGSAPPEEPAYDILASELITPEPINRVVAPKPIQPESLEAIGFPADEPLSVGPSSMAPEPPLSAPSAKIPTAPDQFGAALANAHAAPQNPSALIDLSADGMYVAPRTTVDPPLDAPPLDAAPLGFAQTNDAALFDEPAFNHDVEAIHTPAPVDTPDEFDLGATAMFDEPAFNHDVEAIHGPPRAAEAMELTSVADVTSAQDDSPTSDRSSGPVSSTVVPITQSDAKSATPIPVPAQASSSGLPVAILGAPLSPPPGSSAARVIVHREASATHQRAMQQGVSVVGRGEPDASPMISFGSVAGQHRSSGPPHRRSVSLTQRRIRERSRTNDNEPSRLHDSRAALLYEEAARAVGNRDFVTAERHLALALSYLPNEPRLLQARDKVRRLRGKLRPV
ncbi:MAG: hypothetical protein AAFV29_00845, partial [Myxococcota bacterium]